MNVPGGKGGCLALLPLLAPLPASSLLSVSDPGPTESQELLAALTSCPCYTLGWICEMGRHLPPTPRATGRMIGVTKLAPHLGHLQGRGRSSLWALNLDRLHVVTLPRASQEALGIVVSSNHLSYNRGKSIPLAHTHLHMWKTTCLPSPVCKDMDNGWVKVRYIPKWNKQLLKE